MTTPATDNNDDEDTRADRDLERAADAVEHQASYGSPSLDDMDAESSDEPAWEPEVTGSAPQEGQLPGQGI